MEMRAAICKRCGACWTTTEMHGRLRCVCGSTRLSVRPTVQMRIERGGVVSWFGALSEHVRFELRERGDRLSVGLLSC